jgi:threonylcarbamoyladenosine tRNA methylthiotransferase MtaB
MKKKGFFIKTLGCKVNQVESACLHDRLSELGFIPTSEESAEVFILNSCAVTEKAVSETKKVVKSWIKRKPKLIVLTGCAVISNKEDFLKLSEQFDFKNLLLLGQRAKLNPSHIVAHLEAPANGLPRFLEDEDEGLPVLKNFYNRSRAFLKIQDGCSSFCSYCIVPYTRGPSRSYPLSQVLEQARLFIEQGYREIVITGIHIGMWGKDLSPRSSLARLLEKLEEEIEQANAKVLLRLSSVEVTEFDEDLFAYLKGSRHICPHFHVPLQSGSNRILKLMNRHYTREEYIEKLEQLKELFFYATFGADVIVGFPTETEEDFAQTFEVVEKSPMNWLHVFPYSPKPGTPAEKIKERVPESVVKHRSNMLRRLIEKKREDFYRGIIGKSFYAIVEKVEEGQTIVLTENYVHALLNYDFTNKSLTQGELIRVKISRVEGGRVIADAFPSTGKSS